MKLLFVADPLEGFKTYKDTTFAMMREAVRRGHTLMACEPKDLRWQQGEKVTGFVRDISLTGDADHWFSAAQHHPDERPQVLADVDAVLMRKDPPFDSEYFYATHLLGQAQQRVEDAGHHRRGVALGRVGMGFGAHADGRRDGRQIDRKRAKRRQHQRDQAGGRCHR